eukprot:473164-Rhodomonas_salina.2
MYGPRLTFSGSNINSSRSDTSSKTSANLTPNPSRLVAECMSVPDTGKERVRRALWGGRLVFFRQWLHELFPDLRGCETPNSANPSALVLQKPAQ